MNLEEILDYIRRRHKYVLDDWCKSQGTREEGLDDELFHEGCATIVMLALLAIRGAMPKDVGADLSGIAGIKMGQIAKREKAKKN